LRGARRLELLAEPRPFPNALAKVALMASDFRAVRERVMARFPIMRSSAFERRMLFDRGSARRASSRPLLVSAPLSPDAVASLV
jgi:hypothetical protein